MDPKFEKPTTALDQDTTEAIEAYREYYEAMRTYMTEGPKELGSAEQQKWKAEWMPRLQTLIDRDHIPTDQLNLILKHLGKEVEGHM